MALAKEGLMKTLDFLAEMSLEVVTDLEMIVVWQEGVTDQEAEIEKGVADHVAKIVVHPAGVHPVGGVAVHAKGEGVETGKTNLTLKLLDLKKRMVEPVETRDADVVAPETEVVTETVATGADPEIAREVDAPGLGRRNTRSSRRMWTLSLLTTPMLEWEMQPMATNPSLKKTLRLE